MKLITPLPGENLMELSKRCNAVYICPKRDGKRIGKLVVYAGKDLQGRNLVGDNYFNFPWVEPHLKAVEAFAEAARQKIQVRDLPDTFDTICGIPEGGRTFGQELARLTEKRFVYPTKAPKPTKAGRKQEFSWDLSRVNFERGERVAIAEDVFNNFQNTDNMLSMIAATGADVVLLVGALNRSPSYHARYIPKGGPYKGHEIPIIASIRQAYPEYEQDDPAVYDDVRAGNVEFEVKKNWADLLASMEQEFQSTQGE